MITLQHSLFLFELVFVRNTRTVTKYLLQLTHVIICIIDFIIGNKDNWITYITLHNIQLSVLCYTLYSVQYCVVHSTVLY